MTTKEVLLQLRTRKGMSQEELAAKIFVTRQAVSRWETGETTPNVETLKLLSEVFDVSINTLLGEQRQLICQCCGMPLEEATFSREADGSVNQDYCQWCYSGGRFLYHDMQDLIDVCTRNMASDQFPPDQVRAYLEGLLPTLKYWQQDTDPAQAQTFAAEKEQLLRQINGLAIPGMPQVQTLFPMAGRYINLEYPLPGGGRARFLADEEIYLATQLDCPEAPDRHFGIAGNAHFLLVSRYEGAGENPELLAFQKR